MKAGLPGAALPLVPQFKNIPHHFAHGNASRRLLPDDGCFPWLMSGLHAYPFSLLYPRRRHTSTDPRACPRGTSLDSTVRTRTGGRTTHRMLHATLAPRAVAVAATATATTTTALLLPSAASARCGSRRRRAVTAATAVERHRLSTSVPPRPLTSTALLPARLPRAPRWRRHRPLRLCGNPLCKRMAAARAAAAARVGTRVRRRRRC